ncbi:hypothetical protein L1D14_04370 [Vibrio tubiashii]|uniref:hypothetical protein n=1 Tax=Vibrio tubiashii TaxID=29498 RepID=UPI001EFEDAA0|nr:hypothetical protein [Vibrio tubiashii]MCG9575467.1 hypothetical protein [Vibrio tubiashii]
MNEALSKFLNQLLPLKTRYFFTWTGNLKTYRIVFTNGEVHEDVTIEMLFDAAALLNAPTEFLSGRITRAHFNMYELAKVQSIGKHQVTHV